MEIIKNLRNGSRILIIVDDSKVADAVRAIHDKRNRIDRDDV